MSNPTQTMIFNTHQSLNDNYAGKCLFAFVWFLISISWLRFSRTDFSRFSSSINTRLINASGLQFGKKNQRVSQEWANASALASDIHMLLNIQRFLFGTRSFLRLAACCIATWASDGLELQYRRTAVAKPSESLRKNWFDRLVLKWILVIHWFVACSISLA